MKLKYFLWDLLKLVVPLVVAQFLPNAPQEAIIEVVLYVFAALLGIDSFIKTVKAVKK